MKHFNDALTFLQTAFKKINTFLVKMQEKCTFTFFPVSFLVFLKF